MGQKTETLGQVTELQASRWGPGYSPKELLATATAEVEDIADIVIVARYKRTSNQDDSYNILTSTMPMHEMLGFIELGKTMSVAARQVDPFEDPAS